METRVLGTEFNVHDYKNGDEPSHVTLVTGKVEVKTPDSENSMILKPGENAQLQEDGSFALQEKDVDQYIYWKEGYFYFDDTPFATILRVFGRW